MILVFAQWAAGDPIGAALGRFPLLRVSTDGLIRQVVVLTPDRPKPVLVAVGDGPARKLTVPFLTYPLVSVSPDGSRIVIVTTDFASPDAGSILVEVFDAAGKQLMDTHIPFRRR